MLHFNGARRFDSPGPIPVGVVNGFSDLISKIVAQGNRRQLLEHIKGHFAGAAGTPHYPSSGAGWAASFAENKTSTFRFSGGQHGEVHCRAGDFFPASPLRVYEKKLRCHRSHLIKTPDRISERPPRCGLSDSEASRTHPLHVIECHRLPCFDALQPITAASGISARTHRSASAHERR